MSTLTPERLAEVRNEHGQQCALFAWSALPTTRELYPGIELMFAVPNGGERNLKVASNLKSEGVKAGVPDIFLPVPRGHLHGFFLELKWGTNQASDKQHEWLEALAIQGYAVGVYWSFEAAKEAIIAYYRSRSRVVQIL